MKKFLIAIALALMSGVASADEPANVTQFRKDFLASTPNPELCSIKMIDTFEGHPILEMYCKDKPLMCVVLLDKELPLFGPAECWPNPSYDPKAQGAQGS